MRRKPYKLAEKYVRCDYRERALYSLNRVPGESYAHVVLPGVFTGGPEGHPVNVICQCRRRPQLLRRDGQHPRACADIEEAQIPVRTPGPSHEGEYRLKAHPCRLV